MNKPKRIQLSRRKGWRMPPNTVSVTRPGKWGNPFLVTQDRTQAHVVYAFEAWLLVEGLTAGIPEKKAAILKNIHTLRGKNLACWCKPGTPCHADVLLAIANQ